MVAVMSENVNAPKGTPSTRGEHRVEGVAADPDRDGVDHGVGAGGLPGRVRHVQGAEAEGQGRAAALQVAVDHQVARLGDMCARGLDRKVAGGVAHRLGQGVVLPDGPAELGGDERQ